MNLDNTILVTHRNCMDGSTSALLFLAAGGKKENIRFSNPSHVDVDKLILEDLIYDIEKSKKILLVDISISQGVAESINKSFYKNDIFIIDHHKSAVPLNKFSFCHIDTDNQNCGCKLFYDWLMSNSAERHDKIHKYKELVELANDNDLWIHHYPESTQLAEFHRLLGQELFIERFVNHSTVDLDCQELYLIRMYHQKQEIEIQNRKKEVRKIIKNINGNEYTFGFVLARGVDQSILGEATYNDPQLGVDVAVIVADDGISFRSRQDCDLDVSKLAKLHGGGGHCHSGGAQLKGFVGKDLIDLVSENMRFEDENY